MAYQLPFQSRAGNNVSAVVVVLGMVQKVWKLAGRGDGRARDFGLGRRIAFLAHDEGHVAAASLHRTCRTTDGTESDSH